ncbi:MAG: zinc ribbon domain-containing protein [Methanobacteriaceae archaeon]|nr:zinc ribbon domain-containing protein [Methanobacteriaceae archaeon]
MNDELKNKNIENQFCPSCGKSIKKDVKFCKNCGKTLGEITKNKIQRMNDKINILAITIGFTVSALFLVIGSVIYGVLLSGQYIDITSYIALVVMTMLFFGGMVIGIISCNDYSDAKISGGFFTLIYLNIIGLIAGFSFSSTVAIASMMSQIIPFSSSDYTTPSTTDYAQTLTNTTSGNSSFDANALFYLLKIIILIILILISGVVGCCFGVFLKKAIKSRYL